MGGLRPRPRRPRPPLTPPEDDTTVGPLRSAGASVASMERVAGSAAAAGGGAALRGSESWRSEAERLQSEMADEAGLTVQDALGAEGTFAQLSKFRQKQLDLFTEHMQLEHQFTSVPPSPPRPAPRPPQPRGRLQSSGDGSAMPTLGDDTEKVFAMMATLANEIGQFQSTEGDGLRD